VWSVLWCPLGAEQVLGTQGPRSDLVHSDRRAQAWQYRRTAWRARGWTGSALVSSELCHTDQDLLSDAALDESSEPSAGQVKSQDPAGALAPTAGGRGERVGVAILL
jgi:hypothetical protein